MEKKKKRVVVVRMYINIFNYNKEFITITVLITTPGYLFIVDIYDILLLLLNIYSFCSQPKTQYLVNTQLYKQVHNCLVS